MVDVTQCTAALTLIFMKSNLRAAKPCIQRKMVNIFTSMYLYVGSLKTHFMKSNLRAAKLCIQRKMVNIFTSMYLCVGSLKTHFIFLTFILLPVCIVMSLISFNIYQLIYCKAKQ